jgi:hypothetical protein
VARVGRNDPCPCGSGKKYKNCCLKKDRAKRIRESAWRREEQVTLDKLVVFAQRPALSAQLVVAFNMFWNGNYGVEGWNALDRDEIGRFLDWYVQDYRMEQSRKRVVDLFIEEMGSKLLAGELERVRTWSDSHMSAYRIAGPAEQGLLPVVDVFQGTGEAVGDDGLGQLSLPGDLVVGRVLHSSAPPHFSWAAILLPAALEAELVAFIIKAHGQYQEAHPQASWPDFLSNSGYMFNHYLLRSAAEAVGGRRTAGAYYDASGTVEELREAERRLRERAARETEERRREEQRPTQEEVEPLRQTQGGILLPRHVQYKGSKELKQ